MIRTSLMGVLDEKMYAFTGGSIKIFQGVQSFVHGRRAPKQLEREVLQAA